MNYSVEIYSAEKAGKKAFVKKNVELRCSKCGKKLFEASDINGGEVEIKCNRCGHLLRITFND